MAGGGLRREQVVLWCANDKHSTKEGDAGPVWAVVRAFGEVGFNHRGALWLGDAAKAAHRKRQAPLPQFYIHALCTDAAGCTVGF